ncbi:cupin domain-containing protein [Streptomyces sp. SM11]|uniref:cupin domain-containing protein n=1 Tax=Streptomyces sp. SM11 TaxID=565557 RepID=UPI0021563C35|nr:cupin domain-containing protein [Streptomyces sp. SM11]
MDVFDELLRGVRGRGAVFGRSVLRAPWSLRFTDGAYLTLCLPLRGAGWIVPEGGEPLRVEVGEVAIVRGPAPFVFTDDPAGGTGAGRAGGVREVHWGRLRDTGAPPDRGPEFDCPTVLLAATYDVQAQVPQRLLRALPPALVVPDEQDCAPMRDYLEAQLGGGRPGDQIVLDRLLDWMLVCTLRDWFDRPEADPPGWYGALGDEVAGPPGSPPPAHGAGPPPGCRSCRCRRSRVRVPARRSCLSSYLSDSWHQPHAAGRPPPMAQRPGGMSERPAADVRNRRGRNTTEARILGIRASVVFFSSGDRI